MACNHCFCEYWANLDKETENERTASHLKHCKPYIIKQLQTELRNMSCLSASVIELKDENDELHTTILGLEYDSDLALKENASQSAEMEAVKAEKEAWGNIYTKEIERLKALLDRARPTAINSNPALWLDIKQALKEKNDEANT